MTFLVLTCAELATAYEEEIALGVPNEEDKVFFERLYPRLEAWFQWFNTSQTGLSLLCDFNSNFHDVKARLCV